MLNELDRVTRELRVTKKEFLERAIRAQAKQLLDQTEGEGSGVPEEYLGGAGSRPLDRRPQRVEIVFFMKPAESRDTAALLSRFKTQPLTQEIVDRVSCGGLPCSGDRRSVTRSAKPAHGAPVRGPRQQGRARSLACTVFQSRFRM